MAKKISGYDRDSAFKSILGLKSEAETDVNLKPSEIAIEGEPLVIAKEKEERRNKSIHVLIRPSIHSRVQKKCKQIGVSMNECINQLLEKWVNE